MERPQWEHGDTIKSIKALFSLGKIAVAEFIGRIDTKLSNSINGEDDE